MYFCLKGGHNVTKLNAYSDQGVDDRWCTGFRTAHTALFTCSAYRAGDGQLFNIIVYVGL